MPARRSRAGPLALPRGPAVAFEGVDFLRLDELLGDEERLARDSVREFVSREFLPRVQEHFRRDGSFPMELVPKLAELGLFGANLHGHGCAGMSNTAKGAAVGTVGGAVAGGVIGRAAGSTAKGVIIGAVVGGATGAIIGSVTCPPFCSCAR